MSIALVIFGIIVFIYSVIFHEVSHGLAAQAMGDNTANALGRLSLNPLKHIDLFGSIILPLITYFTIGFIFGYAKPVPYDPRNLNDRRYGPIKVALAGPAANLGIALIFGLALRFFGAAFASETTIQVFSMVVLFNLILAIFNLFPVPPLDGHWVIVTLFPQLQSFLYRYSIFLFVIFLFLIYPFVFPLVPWLYHLITGIVI
ncbi:MAG TPA: site-2 protease family protein [Candidatus Paceibacterota bacterium]|nr:site-2 protease family protein [Candidatus Paceibacterota bacterium]